MAFASSCKADYIDRNLISNIRFAELELIRLTR